MNESIKVKDASPLVQTVITLDQSFSELERIGTKLAEMDLKSESQFEYAKKLLAFFSEHGEKMTDEVRQLSKYLIDLQTRAASITERVSARADLVSLRNQDQDAKLQQFHVLAEKVRGFNSELSQLRREEGVELTDEDKKTIAQRLKDFDSQLEPLINEAREIRKDAASSKMKALEQNADSLAQTLQAVRSKIRALPQNG